MLVLRLALRNLRRHLRRSVITGLAISLGLALLMFSSAGTDGMTDSLIANATGSTAGHVVVQGIGWQEERDADIIVPDSPAVVRQVQQAVPHGLVVQRVFMDGLLSSSSGSVGAALSAVQPELEAQVNEVDDRIVVGTYLDGNPRGIVIGSSMAHKLDVGLGDKIVLMAQGPDGIESRLFRVQGIFQFGIEGLDGLVAHVPLESAQQVLGLGDDVTQISVHLEDAKDTPAALTAVVNAVSDRPVDALSWEEALPMIADYVRSEKAEIYVIYGVLFFMVGLGIVNTVLMSVLERMREFAVMLAIGYAPGQLVGIILCEGAVLGAIASASGLVLGSLILWPFRTSGLDMSALYGGQLDIGNVPLDLVIHFEPDPVKLAAYAVVTTAMTVAASLYPAWQAYTVRPTEHMHHR